MWIKKINMSIFFCSILIHNHLPKIIQTNIRCQLDNGDKSVFDYFVPITDLNYLKFGFSLTLTFTSSTQLQIALYASMYIKFKVVVSILMHLSIVPSV